MVDIQNMQRELTPFEQLVLELMCQGKSNKSIAEDTGHSEKVIENSVSRSARVFGIMSDENTNVRVLLALAYRTHFGDNASGTLVEECQDIIHDALGISMCAPHVD